MKEQTFTLIGSEHKVNIGKIIFTVNSFADTSAEKTAEQLIIDMLRSRISECHDKEISA